MTKPDGGEREPLKFNELKEAARDCLVALAVKGLREQGQAQALAMLHAIDAGQAHVTFAVELSAGRGLIVGQVNYGGELLPLLAVDVLGMGHLSPLN